MLSQNSNFTEVIFNSIQKISENPLPMISLGNDPQRIGFTMGELEILRVVSRVFSSFSILGLIFVQYVFWFFPTIRTFAFELVAWLCFSNIMFNVSNYLPVEESDNMDAFNAGTLSFTCSAQAGLNIYFDLSSMIWTTIIGYTAFTSVTRQESLDANKKYYRLAFIISAYAIPLAFTLM